MKAVAVCAVAALLAGCAGQPRAAGTGRVGPAIVVAAPAGAGGFVGSEACRGCHPGQRQRWLATAHARPYAGLAPADRGNPACLRCHLTGYPEAFRATGGAADPPAVGCEACHGPGADHAGSGHPELVPTATGGECPPCELNRICRLCHTPERSPAFDLAEALNEVSCRP